MFRIQLYKGLIKFENVLLDLKLRQNNVLTYINLKFVKRNVKHKF